MENVFGEDRHVRVNLVVSCRWERNVMENVHFKYYHLGSTSTRQTIILYYHTSNHDSPTREDSVQKGGKLQNVWYPILVSHQTKLRLLYKVHTPNRLWLSLFKHCGQLIVAIPCVRSEPTHAGWQQVHLPVAHALFPCSHRSQTRSHITMELITVRTIVRTTVIGREVPLGREEPPPSTPQ